MQKYGSIYIDESGDNGTSSRYIVFAILATDAGRALEKLVKKVWRATPQVGSTGELHASRASMPTKRKLLEGLAQIEVDSYFSVIDKRNSETPVDEVYYLELARLISIFQPPPGLVVVDKKETDRKRAKILAQLNLTGLFAPVKFEQSHHIKQLQAADFVAWAIGRYLERGDNSFMELVPRLTHLQAKRKPFAFPDR